MTKDELIRLEVGTKVQYSGIVTRQSRRVEDRPPPLSVQYGDFYLPSLIPKFGEGWYMGYRTVSDGWTYHDAEYGPVWIPLAYHTVALVVVNPRQKPLFVRPEELSVAPLI
jgi:hypothetical protein